MLNGWIILDKPAGIGSTTCLNKIKKTHNISKIGHAGTLDPLASGILPVAIGEACKLTSYFMDDLKEYEFTVEFGSETSTLDLEGEVIATSGHLPTESDIKAVLSGFIGNISQIPPAYSAIKQNGKRAYDLARSGVEVCLSERSIYIESIELTSYSNTSSSFRVLCGKGTYIRSLARDIALKCGSFGHVTKLIRTKIGKFSLIDAISLDSLLNLMHTAPIIKPLEIVLDDIPVINLTKEQAISIKCGKKLMFPNEDIKLIQATFDNMLIAIGSINSHYFESVRVFNLFNEKGD